MFVGAGSASTGGGIKVTTFVLLLLMVWAEMRGEPVNVVRAPDSGGRAASGARGRVHRAERRRRRARSS